MRIGVLGAGVVGQALAGGYARHGHETRIGNRVALATALFEGRGITESGRGSRAAEEITALADEILKKAKS